MSSEESSYVPEYMRDIVTRLQELVRAIEVCEAEAKEKNRIDIPIKKEAIRAVLSIFERAKEMKFLGKISELVGVTVTEDGCLQIYPKMDDSLRAVQNSQEEYVDVIAILKAQLESLQKEPSKKLLGKLVPENQARVLQKKPMVDYSRMPVDTEQIFECVMQDFERALNSTNVPFVTAHETPADPLVKGMICEVSSKQEKLTEVKIPCVDKETASAVKWFLDKVRKAMKEDIGKNDFSTDSKAHYVSIRAKNQGTVDQVLRVLQDLKSEGKMTEALSNILKSEMQKHFAKTVYNMPESAAAIAHGVSVAD